MNLIKRKYCFALFAILIISIIGLITIENLGKMKNTYAESIDYESLDFNTSSFSMDMSREDIIYKISCKNVREFVEKEQLEKYVVVLSFRASNGCQIYFVDGKPCSLEDIEYGEYETTMYSEFYEILHYDETNKYVYIKFKNMSNYKQDDLEDLGFLLEENDYNDYPGYLYLSEITNPITEITKEDVFFTSETKAADGGNGATNYNIYSIEYILKINQKVRHLVDKIEFTILKGSEDYSLQFSWYGEGAGEGENGYLIYEIPVLGNIDDVLTEVQIRAKVIYGNKSVEVDSETINLMSLWIKLVNNNFSGYNYENYMTNKNKDIIRKYVAMYNKGFVNDIKGSQNYFVDFNNKTDLKISSIIWRFPITNLRTGSIMWSSDYWQGYCYYAGISINEKLEVSAIAEKIGTDEQGLITFSTNPSNNTISTFSATPFAMGERIESPTTKTQLLEATDNFAYNGYMYIRINDSSMVEQYMPQRATVRFSVGGSDTSYNSIKVGANTATIIYDDYNQELLAQITALNNQLTQLTRQLEQANLLSESQREEITSLKSRLDGLTFDLENREVELEYMTEQLETMRNEYQVKIDQLIAENEGKPLPDKPKPSDEEKQKEETPKEEEIVQDFVKENSSLLKLLGIVFGALIIVAIFVALLPTGGGKKLW